MKKNIPKELDFTQEIQNAERTRKFFENNPRIRVPKIYHNYSNVLFKHY